MPTRGRPDRPHSSPPESGVAYGQGSVREVSFGLGVELAGETYTGFDLRIGVADQRTRDLVIGIGVATQGKVEAGIGIGVMEWSGNQKTKDEFGVGITVGDGAGYAGSPRISVANALSLGQEARRRGEPIAVVD